MSVIGKMDETVELSYDKILQNSSEEFTGSTL